jgi:hypothetical protein
MPLLTPEQLAAQQAQIQQQLNNLRAPTTTMGGQMDAYQARQQQLMSQLRNLSQQQQAMQNTTAAANDPVQKAKDEMYGLARGAVTTKNPIDQQILAMLQERTGADAGPFNAETRNALMTSASDAASQAMLNAKGRINGSAGDPSVVAANNEADARRSLAIQQAQLGINTQANVANYDARGQALGQLGGYNQAVQRNQTDNERYLMGLLSQESQYRSDGQPTGGIPSYTQYSQSVTAPQQTTSTPWQGFTNGGTYSQTSGYAAPRQTTTVAPITQQGATGLQPWQSGAPANYTMTGAAGTVTGQNATKTVAPTAAPKTVASYNVESDQILRPKPAPTNGWLY